MHDGVSGTVGIAIDICIGNAQQLGDFPRRNNSFYGGKSARVLCYGMRRSLCAASSKDIRTYHIARGILFCGIGVVGVAYRRARLVEIAAAQPRKVETHSCQKRRLTPSLFALGACRKYFTNISAVSLKNFVLFGTINTIRYYPGDKCNPNRFKT